MKSFDLNWRFSGALLHTLEHMNATRGRGRVISLNRVQGDMHGKAYRVINFTHHAIMGIRPIRFRFDDMGQGKYRVYALGTSRVFQIEEVGQ